LWVGRGWGWGWGCAGLCVVCVLMEACQHVTCAEMCGAYAFMLFVMGMCLSYTYHRACSYTFTGQPHMIKLYCKYVYTNPSHTRTYTLHTHTHTHTHMHTYTLHTHMHTYIHTQVELFLLTYGCSGRNAEQRRKALLKRRNEWLVTGMEDLTDSMVCVCVFGMCTCVCGNMSVGVYSSAGTTQRAAGHGYGVLIDSKVCVFVRVCLCICVHVCVDVFACVCLYVCVFLIVFVALVNQNTTRSGHGHGRLI